MIPPCLEAFDRFLWTIGSVMVGLLLMVGVLGSCALAMRCVVAGAEVICKWFAKATNTKGGN